jgi:ubiquinone/menaquinone biosynthesis C-methylase UbiE
MNLQGLPAVEPKLQRRIQRSGWDLAVDAYEPLWAEQLAGAQTALLALAAPRRDERVLDVACGTGLVTFDAAWEIGGGGSVLGVDISGQMVEAARRRAQDRRAANIAFARMDAEALDLPDASFDVVLCSLGLMYVPDPEQAVREMRRVLRPGGRLALAVWGERAHCAWSAVLGIVDGEVVSDVCPLFFHLGQGDRLAALCARAGFEQVAHRRIHASLAYADAQAACDAAFLGGPVALAWSRFGEETRARARAAYLEAIEPWRRPDGGYELPGEFVIVGAVAPRSPAPCTKREALP